MRYTIAFALTLSLAFPTLVSGCGEPVQAAPPVAALPPLVQVAAIEQDDRPAPVSVIGVLASKAERRLSFKVGGLIEKITVDEGQTVRRGRREVDQAHPPQRPGRLHIVLDLAGGTLRPTY